LCREDGFLESERSHTFRHFRELLMEDASDDEASNDGS
jgi:hypothetical protein